MIKKTIVAVSIVLLILLVVTIYFIAKYKIESVYHTKVSVDKIESSKIYISPNDAYKFKINDVLYFNFDGKQFSATIKNLSYDSNFKAYYAEIYSIDFNLIPGSVADITLIVEDTNVMKAILGSV